jgi:hypothetical protein
MGKQIPGLPKNKKQRIFTECNAMKKLYILKYFLSVSLLLTLISCEEIVLEKDISGDHVTLVAPYNEAQLNATGISFSWDALENASSYRLQVAKPNFTNPIQIVVDTLVSSTTFASQFAVGNYEWRVKGVNGGYETPYTNRNFTILSNDDFESNTVVLQSPVNSFVTNTNQQSLSWQPVLGATSYDIQVFDSANTVISEESLTTTNWSFTFGEGSFQWRVRASNGSQQTLYSTRSLFVDTVNPNTPTLILPESASILPAGDVSFSWSRTPISGTAESDSIYAYTNSSLTLLKFKAVAGTSPHIENLDEGTYYWFMKSFDDAGNVSAQSSVSSFTVD